MESGPPQSVWLTKEPRNWDVHRLDSSVVCHEPNRAEHGGGGERDYVPYKSLDSADFQSDIYS